MHVKVCTSLLAAALGAAMAPFAGAAVFSSEAAANATVQPAGPRTGTSGTNFLNIENSNSGNFASFGVVDFDGAALLSSFRTAVADPSASIDSINSLTLKLFDAPAGFSANGQVNLYLASDTTTSIANDGTSPLVFDGSSEGVGNQLGTLTSLGSATYTNSGAAGTEFDYALSNSAASDFISAINGQNALRLVITPGDATVAATYAGATNSTATSHPQLSIDANPVPEPVSLGVLGLGAVAILARRRRPVLV